MDVSYTARTKVLLSLSQYSSEAFQHESLLFYDIWNSKDTYASVN